MRPSSSLIANAVSCSNSFNSSNVWGWDIVRCSYQVSVSSGSMNGTFELQGSNDLAVGLPANQFSPTNWNTLGSASYVVCSSSPTQSSFLIPMQEVCYQYMRVVFTKSAQPTNGVVSIRFNAFGL